MSGVHDRHAGLVPASTRPPGWADEWTPEQVRGDGEELARAAVRLAGLAGVLLGWRPEEFWRATPAELAAVIGALAGEATATGSGADLARLQEMFPDG